MAVAGNYPVFILEFKSGLIYVQTLGLKAALGPEKKKKKKKKRNRKKQPIKQKKCFHVIKFNSQVGT